MRTYTLQRTIREREYFNCPALVGGSLVYSYSGTDVKPIDGYVCVSLSMNLPPCFYLPIDAVM